MTALQTDIEQRLAESRPDVEVLLAEVIPASSCPTLRIYIDHPAGVTLGLCEEVSGLLRELTESYRLEVSSPGSERPLSKPEHFRHYVGRRARVRLRSLHDGERLSADPPAERGSVNGQPREIEVDDAVDDTGDPRDTRSASLADARGRRNFTGELVGATDSEITLAAEDGLVAIPYAAIRRSNLVEE